MKRVDLISSKDNQDDLLYHLSRYKFVSKICLGEEQILPLEVATWANIVSTNPLIRHRPIVCNKAASLNDSGKKFYQIARLIERNL
mgnify:CR=1 FL=1